MYGLIVTTTETVPGKEIGEILGVARGSTVRAKHCRKRYFCWIEKSCWWRD